MASDRRTAIRDNLEQQLQETLEEAERLRKMLEIFDSGKNPELHEQTKTPRHLVNTSGNDVVEALLKEMQDGRTWRLSELVDRIMSTSIGREAHKDQVRNRLCHTLLSSSYFKHVSRGYYKLSSAGRKRVNGKATGKKKKISQNSATFAEQLQTLLGEYEQIAVQDLPDLFRERGWRQHLSDESIKQMARDTIRRKPQTFKKSEHGVIMLANSNKHKKQNRSRKPMTDILNKVFEESEQEAIAVKDIVKLVEKKGYGKDKRSIYDSVHHALKNHTDKFQRIDWGMWAKK